MPIFRSFLRVCLVWLLRAVALRCCLYWIVLVVCWISAVDAWPLSHQLPTSAPTAVWTWQTVSSGFSPPQPLSRAGQEQVADARQDQVSLEAEPTTAFPLVEPDFADTQRLFARTTSSTIRLETSITISASSD